MKNPATADIIDKAYNDIQDEKLKEMKAIEKQIMDNQDEELDDVKIKNGLNNAIR